jgi:predicted ATPase
MQSAVRTELSTTTADLIRMDNVRRPRQLWAGVAGRVSASVEPMLHNIPLQPTPLVDRAEEVAAIAASLSQGDVRLLTLTGPGGVGKTHLAFAAAGELATSECFRDGVWQVDLAGLRESELLPTAIADVLGLPAAADGECQWLAQMLKGQVLLLLLDNVEHLLPGAALLVADLLATCPRVRMLATSREPLRLRWEQVLRLGGLAVPSGGARDADLERLAAVPSVALYLARARAAGSPQALTPDTALAVIELVRRLDGLPLAIELVAARTPVLTPSQLLSRLDEQWADTPPLRDIPDRHRSLRATVAWSYALLSADEQALLRRVAVFTGSWTLEAAAAVAGPPAGNVTPTLAELVGSLVDKSLIAPRHDAGPEVQFVLTDPVRRFALEALVARDEADEARELHRVFLRGHGRTSSRDAARESGGCDLLSDRERAVLRRVGEGKTSKEISRELYIAERTVKAHVTSVLNKLGAVSRSQALAVAVREGLL